MRIGVGGVITCVLLLSACGTTTSQRAATGGLTGLGIGALAGGPVGAAIGGTVGAFAGWVTPASADDMALAVLRPAREAIAPAVATSGTSEPPSVKGKTPRPSPPATSLQISPDAAKSIQTTLKDQGLYKGPIDGVIGPHTRQALASFQEQHGLTKTSVLDSQTLQALTSSSAGASGSTTPAGKPAPGPTGPSGGTPEPQR